MKVSGTLYRGDKAHEKFPEPLDSALAAELMDLRILKGLSIRPRFAVLQDEDGRTAACNGYLNGK